MKNRTKKTIQLPISTGWKAIVLASITLGLTNIATAQNQQAEITEGQTLYEDFGCFQCHGFEGQGNQASPPNPRIAPTQHPFEAFSILVRTPVRLMPAYSPAVLSDAQLLAIYEYMRSIPEPPSVDEIPLLRDLR